MTERIGQKLAQQFGAWERYEMSIPEWMSEWHDAQQDVLAAKRKECMRLIEHAWAGTLMAEFVENTPGLGSALFLVLSLAPDLSRFPNPAKFWKYIGLHAARASERKYNAQLKAWCIFRVAEPCMKLRASPYRAVYDARKSTRPEMLPAGQCEFCDAAYAKRKATGKAGWDCHNLGGPHYKPAHANVDALGVTAKAIMLDAWRIAHGMEPKYGNS
jgi:hypothetical protein